MRGIHVKRGVETTLERVFNNTGRRFEKLSFSWSGSTAGVCINRSSIGLDASVIFPGIDETADVPKSFFNELIGYALHELGHVWFTDDEPWNLARSHHGKFVSNLINGLEDPRIEQCVIDSGFAPNSQHLFENLINAVLAKDGYVEPDDLKNVPFLLAIEGRRLNGYPIMFPSIIDRSPWAADLHWALEKSSRARNTQQIVGIAVELAKRLQEQSKPKNQGKDQDQDQGKEKGKQGDQGDQDGQDGQDGDQGGDQGNDQGSDGQDQGEQSGRPGQGKSDLDDGRDVEPRSFIEDQAKEHQADCDSGRRQRPNVGKPTIEEIVFT